MPPAMTRAAFRGAFLHLYDADPAFAHDLRLLYRLRVRRLPWPLPSRLADWWWPVTRPGPRATTYINALNAVAATHGLDRFRDDPPPGIFREQLHQWCQTRQEFGARHWPPRFFGSGFSLAADQPYIFPVRRDPLSAIEVEGQTIAVVSEEEEPALWDPREEPRADAERRLRANGVERARARATLNAIEDLAGAAGYRRIRARGDGTASELERDFRWLYRRVHGETSAAIAASEGDPGLEAVVHRATGRLAQRVGIRVRGWDVPT